RDISERILRTTSTGQVTKARSGNDPHAASRHAIAKKRASARRLLDQETGIP
ncbi:hypothetical protein BGZ94_003059, partial [Podila epigama]